MSEKPLLLKEYLHERKKIVDDALDLFLPGEDSFPSLIFRSMRYSVFAGGKRLRPILCMAAAEAVGGDIQSVLPVACAIELIHTYSLIHDDLPSMDDDDFRRGMSTNHKVFGEGIAILAGDALLTEAFHLMSCGVMRDRVSPEALIATISEVSVASGFDGMIGGQVVDLDSEGKDAGMETLHYIHSHKTEALLTVSIRAGALLSGASKTDMDALSAYGKGIGLAFQITDDILDIEGDSETLGKVTGSDEAHKKVTFPALLGLDASRKKGRESINEALSSIAHFDDRADPLRMIAKFIIERKS
ncbi:MAG: polyprenyl synthetase family protein [Deltaproteobacteria bacterium]|nr:polyprenyl synthetase family protein [Deltaproteobacteria bacterium]